MNAKVFLAVVVVLGVGALAAWYAYQAQSSAGQGVVFGDGTPPPGAEMLPAGWSAEAIIGEVRSAGRGNHDAAAASFIDLWVPEPGWDGGLEAERRQAGARIVSMFQHRSGVIGGGFWIVAHLPGDEDRDLKHRLLSVTGRIDAVEQLSAAGGQPALWRIVLKPARLVRVGGS